MSSVLAALALVVLLGLALLSVVRQRESLSVEKEEAHVRSHAGDAQHERSASRLAAIRSNPEAAGSGTDSRNATSGTPE